jgi:ketosteroid isomerase-like protein
MATSDPQHVVVQFNEAINTRDLDALCALVTDDHSFIDPADRCIRGRDAVREAWRGFFVTFPDYRNVFERIEVRGDRAVISGRSICSVAALCGPALWTAVVRDAAIAEWRVYDDNADTRRALALQPA